jgi:hypothetical protein
MPRAEPVTIADLPSSTPIAVLLLVVGWRAGYPSLGARTPARRADGRRRQAAARAGADPGRRAFVTLGAARGGNATRAAQDPMMRPKSCV